MSAIFVDAREEAHLKMSFGSVAEKLNPPPPAPPGNPPPNPPPGPPAPPLSPSSPSWSYRSLFCYPSVHSEGIGQNRTHRIRQDFVCLSHFLELFFGSCSLVPWILVYRSADARREPSPTYLGATSAILCGTPACELMCTGISALAHLLDVRLVSIFADAEHLYVSIVLPQTMPRLSAHLVVLGVVDHDGCRWDGTVISFVRLFSGGLARIRCFVQYA